MPKCVTLSGTTFLWVYCKLLDNTTSKNLCTKLCVNWCKWWFPFTYYTLARKCITDITWLTGPSAPTALKAAIPRTEKARLTLLPLIVGSFRGSENQTVMHFTCYSSECSSLKPIHQSQSSVLKISNTLLEARACYLASLYWIIIILFDILPPTIMEENGHQLAGTIIYNWMFFIPDTATPYKKDNAGTDPRSLSCKESKKWLRNRKNFSFNMSSRPWKETLTFQLL